MVYADKRLLVIEAEFANVLKVGRAKATRFRRSFAQRGKMAICAP